ncbi:phage Gp37/Gp68 family protein [Chenggangzhangella methanolivorans]|uniref:Phage Gp37/Gp68 family protein n=1 Tax=Chenggangzhangella methanolivorans TaxID=1437009 RepID=A0A9E6REJ0_9HYPH|nr:phage Gp37/Gp68 family protein [Chenggangzhangella methanolivorans]QZN99750.1 phage Gp37/Gp68 family protein [Chenggangzhangella methanolivorans]
MIGHAPLPNVWLGFSAEDQERFDERWTAVKPLAKAGWLTWWSAEPLLGPVDPSAAIPEVHHHPDNVRSPALDALVRAAATMIGPGLRWVVTGGESGPGARPMHPDWARSLRDRCAAAGVPFLFKQWGEWAPSTPEQAAGNPRSGWRCLAGHPHVARREELYPEAGAAFIERVGKKAAGRTLDGVIHDAYPEPSV